MRAPSPDLLGSELQMFGQVVEDLARREVLPVAAEIDQTAILPPSLLTVLASNELLVAGLADGGEGGEPAAALVVERLAAASAAAAAVAAVTHAAGTYAPSLTERLATAPLAGIARAEVGDEVHLRREHGELILRGMARRVELAGIAEWLVVIAIDGDEPRVVLVDATASDLEWGIGDQRTGLHGVVTRSVTLWDVRVSPDAVVGDRAAVEAGRRMELLLAAALCSGIGRAAVTEAVRYLAERRQFGQRLSEFAALRAMVASMSTRVRAGCTATFAAALGSTGLSEAAVAASSAAGAVVDVAVDAVQLHGGYGWMTEYPVERLMRDAATARARIGGARATSAPVSDAAFNAG